MANEMAILVDESKCTACRACQVACKAWNQNSAVRTVNHGSYENPMSLGSDTWMRILFKEEYRDGRMSWFFTKHQCMHCTEAACVDVCPPNATMHEEIKLPDGSAITRVVTDPDKCIGCNYCRVACPFDVPGYDQKEKGIKRCTLCVDRISNGVAGFDKPACVKVCAPNALVFGNREELLGQGEARVAELQKAGYADARLYGKSELGGLRYMYVLAGKPSEYKLPADPSVPVGVTLYKTFTKPYGAVALAGLAAALVINGIINARNRGLEAKYKLDE